MTFSGESFSNHSAEIQQEKSVHHHRGTLLFRSVARPQGLRAARLQNETVPEKLLNRYKKRFEKREKKIQKPIRNATKNILVPLRPLKNISPAFF